MKRYLNIATEKIQGKEVYKTTQYPDIPLSANDLYLYTTVGDRYDTLAQQYYDDSTFWWVIAAANPNLGYDSLTPPIGAQIRIPQNPYQVLGLYNTQNSK